MATYVKRTNVWRDDSCLIIPYTKYYAPHTTPPQSLAGLHHDTDTTPLQYHFLCVIASFCTVGLRSQPFFGPFPQDSDPEWWGEGTLGVLGHRMSGRNLLEHLIIQGSSVPLTDGTKIPTHDPGKAGKFGDMKPLPMGI